MNSKQHIIDILSSGLYAENSFLSPQKILAGIPLEIALRSVNGFPYTIFEILHHLIFWQDRFTFYLGAEDVIEEIGWEEGWRVAAFPADQTEWETYTTRFLDGLKKMEEFIHSKDWDAFKARHKYSNGYQVIQSLITHNAYHLGQIMLLRRILGNYPPPGGAYVW